jgi:hypothetical protein
MSTKAAQTPDTEIDSAIKGFSRNILIHLLDEAGGVGCRDEDDKDSLRKEVKAQFAAGNISREDILDLV